MSDKQLWDYHQDTNRKHLEASHPRQNYLLKQLSKLSLKGWTILEIWFWDGYLLNKISLSWFNALWQDLSSINIENTKKQWNNGNIDFLLWDDSGKLIVSDASIDCFIASEVLEHMSDEELNVCISEIYRALKVWGYAILTFPAEENLKNSECACPNCGEAFHKWGHKQYWNQEKITKVFRDFKILKQFEFFNRYSWTSLITKCLGYTMYVLRTIINKFYPLENRSYFLLLRKE